MYCLYINPWLIFIVYTYFSHFLPLRVEMHKKLFTTCLFFFQQSLEQGLQGTNPGLWPMATFALSWPACSVFVGCCKVNIQIKFIIHHDSRHCCLLFLELLAALPSLSLLECFSHVISHDFSYFGSWNSAMKDEILELIHGFASWMLQVPFPCGCSRCHLQERSGLLNFCSHHSFHSSLLPGIWSYKIWDNDVISIFAGSLQTMFTHD